MLTRFLLLVFCAAALSGCGSLLTATTSDVAGIAGAGAASAVTKSPAAAAGIGLGIAAGANAGLQYVERDVHTIEQDHIAAVAGDLPLGVVGHWSVTHRIPIEDDGYGRERDPPPRLLHRDGLPGRRDLEMGIRGACNSALGRLAVKARVLTGPVLASVILLAGCNSTARIAAVVTGGIAGASTGSPAVGFLVGVATDAGANYVVRYYGRERQGAEQDAIAQAAGDLPVGTEADWKVEHTIPIGNEHGRLRVVRAIDTPLTSCKELAFSVEDDKQRSWFTTNICKQATQWKWAAAEPAVARWGFLQ